MKEIIFALIAGLIFGLGLVVGGMTDPMKVLAFLDVFGIWDPSLAFVMAGGIIVTFMGYYLQLNRGKLVIVEHCHIPTKTALDSKLISGAAMFGIGWGLVGICPGPAFTTLYTVPEQGIVFVIAMIIGMTVYDKVIAR